MTDNRRRLPATRVGQTHKVTITDMQLGDLDLYVITNRHPGDSAIGEVFLSAGKQGSTLQGLLDGWAVMVSIALQYGVPLEAITEKFRGWSFPPCGATSDSTVPQCASLFDYVARHLAELDGGK